MITLSFARSDNRWYILVAGTLEERVMILGADTLLDIAAEGTGTVYQSFFIHPTTNDNKYLLQQGKSHGYSALFKRQDIPSGGASYACPSYKDKHINQYLWLGDAVGRALGSFPEVILFKKK